MEPEENLQEELIGRAEENTPIGEPHGRVSGKIVTRQNQLERVTYEAEKQCGSRAKVVWRESH